jgi:hypothetical protein
MSLALVKTAASYFIVKIKKKVASICVHEPLSAHGIYMKKKRGADVWRLSSVMVHGRLRSTATGARKLQF